MKKVYFLILFFTMLAAQEAPPKPMSPIVAYWKTLSPEQKETYLFSYLTQTYDTYVGLKSELGYNELTKWYYDHRAELVFGIFDQLKQTEMKEFIGWVDEFYRHPDFADKPFNEALAFAFRFQQASGESLWEKYENLKFGKIKPTDD